MAQRVALARGVRRLFGEYLDRNATRLCQKFGWADTKAS
jgi:hypothetical protein